MQDLHEHGHDVDDKSRLIAVMQHYLDGDTQHEAEQQLVLLKQAPADIAVEGIGDVGHQIGDAHR